MCFSITWMMRYMPHDSGIHAKTWLRIRHMVLLVALDESRNMHAAARQLNISQPAASKMLKDIEGFLGIPLFLREPGRMEPTEAGVTVLRYARRLLNDTDRLVEELASLREGGHGRLALGSVPGAAPVMASAQDARLTRPFAETSLVSQAFNANSAVATPAAQAQPRVNGMLLRHSEFAARHSGQGVMPFARLVSMDARNGAR